MKKLTRGISHGLDIEPHSSTRVFTTVVLETVGWAARRSSEGNDKREEHWRPRERGGREGGWAERGKKHEGNRICGESSDRGAQWPLEWHGGGPRKDSRNARGVRHPRDYARRKTWPVSSSSFSSAVPSSFVVFTRFYGPVVRSSDRHSTCSSNFRNKRVINFEIYVKTISFPEFPFLRRNDFLSAWEKFIIPEDLATFKNSR